MKFVLTYCLTVFTLINFGQGSIQNGNELYEQGQYQEAVDVYSSLIADEQVSADLYYNLGNSYYRNDEIGKSIWAYESALKFDPDHEDALFNLNFVNAQTIDKIDISRQGFGHWLQGIVFTENINFWVYLGISCSVLLSLLIILFIKSVKGRKRNLLLLASTAIAVVLMTSVVIGAIHKERLTSRDRAIVISELAEIKMSPLESATTSFSLGAGAKVKLVDSKDDWIQIEINGNKGWVMRESVWEI